MKSTTFVALVLALCLVVGALFIGAQRGWSEERKTLDASLSELSAMLDKRVEVANNLLTVAQREQYSGLVDNSLIASVKDSLKTLSAPSASLPQKAKANEDFETAAKSLLKTLAQLDAVKADALDSRYVTQTLPQMLEKSMQSADALINGYNNAAQDYNSRLNASAGALFARLLGINAAQPFTVSK